VPARSHVCAEPGCPQLTPCPTHTRTGAWTERDRHAQAWFRKQLIHRSGGTCERCHAQPGVVAHHDRPGYDPECGRLLCDDCHTAIDNHARRTR
jgi:hypothetical protein